jgi:two-component system response regulator YesN
MRYKSLNPFVRSAEIYERVGKNGECVGVDSRIFYIISGDLQISAGGTKLGHLSAGNLIYIPAGVPYKLKGQYVRMAVITLDLTEKYADDTEKIPPVGIECRDAALPHTDTFAPFDKVILIKDAEGMRDEFTSLAGIFTTADGDFRDELSARVKLILLKIARSNDPDALPSQMLGALDEYIRENCSSDISNTEIGAIFGYHPFYVSSMLKEKRGITLKQYIISYRLRLAKGMLELTDKPTQEIAEECGFTDSSYFAKSFKAAFGMTPKEYRNKFKDEFI